MESQEFRGLLKSLIGDVVKDPDSLIDAIESLRPVGQEIRFVIQGVGSRIGRIVAQPPFPDGPYLVSPEGGSEFVPVKEYQIEGP